MLNPVVYLTSDALLEDYSNGRLDYENLLVFLPVPVLFDPKEEKVPTDWYLVSGASRLGGFREVLKDFSSTISMNALMQMNSLCWGLVSALKSSLKTIPRKRLAYGRSIASLRLFLAQNDLPAPHWLEDLAEQEEPDWKKLVIDLVEGRLVQSEVTLIVESHQDINRRLLADVADVFPENLGYVFRA